MRDNQPSQKDSLVNNKSAMELLSTLKPGYKTGIKMRVDVYKEMKREIIDLIKHEETMPLQSFFEILHAKFVNLLGVETGWYLLHVKLDLETRNVIKVERSKGTRNIRTYIKMATGYRKGISGLSNL